MILPTKHLSQDRALLTVAAKLLRQLEKPKTVSALWEKLSRRDKNDLDASSYVTYDWFVLALDLLFTFGAIELEDGLVTRQLK